MNVRPKMPQNRDKWAHYFLFFVVVFVDMLHKVSQVWIEVARLEVSSMKSVDVNLNPD